MESRMVVELVSGTIIREDWVEVEKTDYDEHLVRNIMPNINEAPFINLCVNNSPCIIMVNSITYIIIEYGSQS